MGWYHSNNSQANWIGESLPMNPNSYPKCQYCGKPLIQNSFAQKYCSSEGNEDCYKERLNTHAWLKWSFGVEYQEIPEFVREVMGYEQYINDLESCFPENWETKVHPKLRIEIKNYLITEILELLK